MSGSIRRAVIVGATGPTGKHLYRELVRGGSSVRVVSRSMERLTRAFGGPEVDRRAADARDAEALARAVEGCDAAFDCIGLPPERMTDHPVTARALARASGSTGVRCVHVSSFWAYMPLERLPLTESHPRTGGPTWVRLRREAEDVLRDAGGAIVHLPDFYGEEVHTSSLQSALREAVAGKTMNWIGGADNPREYVHVRDAMEAVARLAARDEAYGADWIVPGPGTITPARVARIAGEHLGREVKLRTAGPLVLRVLSLFNRPLREFMQMAPAYLGPIRYDGSKLRSLIGDVSATAYADGIPRTLAWLSFGAG